MLEWFRILILNKIMPKFHLFSCNFFEIILLNDGEIFSALTEYFWSSLRNLLTSQRERSLMTSHIRVGRGSKIAPKNSLRLHLWWYYVRKYLSIYREIQWNYFKKIAGKQMELGHYFIENQNSEPFEHRAFISLLDSGIDEESGLRDHSYIT